MRVHTSKKQGQIYYKTSTIDSETLIKLDTEFDGGRRPYNTRTLYNDKSLPFASTNQICFQLAFTKA